MPHHKSHKPHKHHRHHGRKATLDAPVRMDAQSEPRTAKRMHDEIVGLPYDRQVEALRPKPSAEYVLASSATRVGDQAKFGPKEGLDEDDQAALEDHYGEHGRETPLERLSQYNPRHATYVRAAEETGRPLTEQEAKAKRTGANVGGASLDHIIASGAGQNLLNRSTRQFQDGAWRTESGPRLEATHPELALQQRRSGLAMQAAAVGRFMGEGRAILEERRGEQGVDVDRKRDQLMRGTLTAFQGAGKDERWQAYKDILKETFDSTGNMRIGDAKANIKISTGFDMPLDRDGRPTARGDRLREAYETFGPEAHLAQMYSTDTTGNRMSSSRETDLDKKRRKLQ